MLTARIAIALEVFLAIGALGGGAALLLGPRGEILPLPVSALAGSPFANYFVPGVILFAIIGLGPLGAALLAWRRHPVAPLLALAVGAALLVWLVVEIAIVGYASNPPLQPLYLALGVVMVLVGGGWMRQTRTQRSTRVCPCRETQKPNHSPTRLSFDGDDHGTTDA